MPPQLRVIEGGSSSLEDYVTVRVDARLRLWGAGLAAVFAIAAVAMGFSNLIPPLVAGPVGAVFLLWSLWLAATFVVRRGTSYSIGPQRIEVERGLVSKRVESVDLWRVRDVVLEQSLLERVRGVGRITVLSNDQVEPALHIGPVPNAKWLYTKLRDSVSVARKDARVVPVDAGG